MSCNVMSWKSCSIQFYSIYKYWHTNTSIEQPEAFLKLNSPGGFWRFGCWLGTQRGPTAGDNYLPQKTKMEVWRLSKDSDDLSSFFFLGYMGVSKNRGTPKSSILIGFSIINHPFWGTPIFGNTHIVHYPYFFATLWQGPIGPSHIIVVRVIWVRTRATWCITWW